MKNGDGISTLDQRSLAGTKAMLTFSAEQDFSAPISRHFRFYINVLLWSPGIWMLAVIINLHFEYEHDQTAAPI